MEYIISFLPDHFPIREHFYVEMTGITWPDKNYHIQRACSDIYCLEYVMEGEGYVDCNGTEFHPHKGDVYLLPAGARHDYRALPEQPFKKIWMNVQGSLCDSLYKNYGLEGRYHFPDCPLLPLFQRFLNIFEANRNDPGEAAFHGELIFHEIMSALFTHADGLAPREKSPAELMKETMDLHIYEKLNISDLGREIGLSPAQLTRVFKKAYKETPYQYFLSQKLAAACSLLRNTNLQIREIADRLRFSDEHYFSAVFHQKTGVSPKVYRRQSQSEPAEDR